MGVLKNWEVAALLFRVAELLALKEDNEYKLQIGDNIKIFLKDDEFEELTKIQKPDKIENDIKKLDKKNIVYEDGDLLIINKNPWINVHPWDFKTKETNLIYQVRDYLWNKLNSLTFKPSLVHRIDRDTSWIVIIAKKKSILTKLALDFKTNKNIKKTYYAIVFWKMPNSFWVIDDKLLRIENALKENKVQIFQDWKKAITNYKVLKTHKIKIPTWNLDIQELEIKIETWKMHQIRVHLANIGCPIILDNKYWNKSLNWYIFKKTWFNRQALHAWKIEFIHYEKNKKISLEANFKDDMKDFLKNIT